MARVKQTERPHPLSPLVHGWLVLVAVVVGFGRQYLEQLPSEELDLPVLLQVLGALLVAVLLAAGWGFATWYFTRFVIDDDEVRVESGVFVKRSKRIPFERLQSVDLIQPLVARLLGLAELRLEAGAGDSTTRLRYLRRAQAARLRDYLLVRAHGRRARLDDTAHGAGTSLFTDLSRQDTPIVQVPPQRLVLGFVCSVEWLGFVLATVAAGVAASVTGVGVIALTGIIPLVIGAASMVGARVVAMFNFTLAESPRGLRVTRGLTNLTSQSIPLDRVQGVRVVQPLLWRPLGWVRVDVDILGYGRAEREQSGSSASSVLLPVATRAEADLAMRRVLPGLDAQRIELLPSPRRAAWLRWFDFWTLRYGWDDRAAVSEHGWLVHVRDIVPHAKTQSVRVRQGPLQRRLRLADVHVDTTRGPVNLHVHQIDPAVARAFALSQLDRARAARAAERLARSEAAYGPGAADAETLAAFGVRRRDQLGAGGESEVFALDEHRVLRLYRSGHEAPEATIRQLRTLYQGWRETRIGLQLPLILEAGRRAGRSFTVDRRFAGVPMSDWLAAADPADRRRGLAGLLDAALRLQQLPSPVTGFARLVGEGAPRQFPGLPELVADLLAGPTTRSREAVRRDVPHAAAVWQRLQEAVAARQVQPALVHGDICPPNAYLQPGPDGPVVTGIGDFSPHTLHADPLIDVTGAVAFVELEAYPDAAADAAWLEQLAVDRLGPDVRFWLETYRRFYAFYFSDTAAADPRLYAWCVAQLFR